MRSSEPMTASVAASGFGLGYLTDEEMAIAAARDPAATVDPSDLEADRGAQHH